MRLNSERLRPRDWPGKWPQTRRMLAIAAALGALALAIGACSLTTGSSSGSGFSSGSGSVTTGSGQTTPVKVIHGGGGTALILVPVTIDGKGPYNFALDTGAGITLIDTDLANALHLQVSGGGGQVSGVGGTQDITPVHVDSWSAGKISLPTADIGRTSLPTFKQNSDVRGLLGSDILSRFGRITINYDTGELSVSDAAAQSLAAPVYQAAAAVTREAAHLRAA